jgi:hypothetical protein
MSTVFKKATFTPTHYLNTALCQSPPGVSKTKKALNFIKQVGIMARVHNQQENGIHHITLISTNKNLEETKQWKIRSKKNWKGINVLVLSSKKGDTNSVKDITHMLSSAKKIDDLPDIIIFCTHHRRMEDLIGIGGSGQEGLIEILNDGNLDFTRIGVHQITTSIMFDEADLNIQLIVDFLKRLEMTIEKDGSYQNNKVIRDIHYITATPMGEFWKKLKTAGITKLRNINTIIKDTDPDSELHLPYDQIMTEYRKIDDHSINKEYASQTQIPDEYARHIRDRILKDREQGKRKEALCIFAPAANEKITHINMRNIWLYPSSPFVVAIHNSDYKGFHFSDGGFESFDDFRRKYKVDGEFRDLLCKWRELNPKTDLVITGYLNVQRGVTFCTKGFNFTDMIISNYHMTNLASLIQILGRANGGKEYVEIMNIWIPESVINAANEWIQCANEALREDPEDFNESHFRKKSKAERDAPAMTVPSVISLTAEEYMSITKKGKSWDEKCIMDFIEKKSPITFNLIKTNKATKDQITQPETEGAIKKQITDLVAGSEGSHKKVISIKKVNKTNNVYQVFMDSRGKRLIVSIWLGKNLVGKASENSTDEE